MTIEEVKDWAKNEGFEVIDEVNIGNLTDLKEEKSILPPSKNVKLRIRKVSVFNNKDKTFRMLNMSLSLEDGITVNSEVKFKNMVVWSKVTYYADPTVYGVTIKDEFGVLWSTSNDTRGAPIKPCPIEPTLSNYKFPDASDSYRFKNIREWIKNNKKNYIIIVVGDFWERATSMRGMENILLDLVYNCTFVEKLLQRIKEYILETMEILFKRFEFDAISLSDDYGSQKSLIMSPLKWRKLIKPHLKNIYALAKKYGKTIYHHSCGNIYYIIGDMIEIGVDILNPIQSEAMDIFKLKKDFSFFT